MQQAKAFTDFVDITGLVLTKLDGTAKGGIVIGVSNELARKIYRRGRKYRGPAGL